MSKVVLLSRVSTIHQSLEQQTEQLVKYAKSLGFKDNDTIVIEDKESAVKLSEEERNGLNKLKEAIDTSNVTDVIVYELSRLARTPKVLYSIRDYLVEKRVQLHVLNPAFKLLKPDGTIDESSNIIFSLFCTLSENEAKMMKIRMNRGKLKAKSENKYTGGAVPFGYTADKDHNFIIKEDEAEIVRRIFKDYQTKTVVDIAKDLVGEGLVKTNVNSTASLVRNVIHRKLYYGEECKGLVYPPIIPKYLYDKVADKIFERKKKSKTKSKHQYLCRGIVTNINNEILKPLYCHKSYTHFNIGKYNWESLSINMPFLDDIVWHYTKQAITDIPSNVKMLTQEMQEEKCSISHKLKRINEKIENEQKSIIKIERRYIDGKISEDTADLLKGEVQSRINVLNREIQRLEARRDEIKKYLNNLSSAMKSPLLGKIDEIPFADKEKLVHEHIKQVIVIKGEKRYSYVFGIQFFGGNYVMVDANARYKRIWDESGVEVAYKNLLTSQQGGNKNKHYTINNGN